MVTSMAVNVLKKGLLVLSSEEIPGSGSSGENWARLANYVQSVANLRGFGE